jgi:hypothetical protein
MQEAYLRALHKDLQQAGYATVPTNIFFSNVYCRDLISISVHKLIIDFHVNFQLVLCHFRGLITSGLSAFSRYLVTL